MIIKALIISALLSNEPMIIAMPLVTEKVEARRRGKGPRGRRRGGSGLR